MLPSIGIRNQLPANARAISGRFTQHEVKALMFAPPPRFQTSSPCCADALEQAMKIEACGTLNRASEAPEAGKIRCEVGIEVRECGSDQRRYADGVFELAS